MVRANVQDGTVPTVSGPRWFSTGWSPDPVAGTIVACFRRSRDANPPCGRLQADTAGPLRPEEWDVGAQLSGTPGGARGWLLADAVSVGVGPFPSRRGAAPPCPAPSPPPRPARSPALRLAPSLEPAVPSRQQHARPAASARSPLRPAPCSAGAFACRPSAPRPPSVPPLAGTPSHYALHPRARPQPISRRPRTRACAGPVRLPPRSTWNSWSDGTRTPHVHGGYRRAVGGTSGPSDRLLARVPRGTGVPRVPRATCVP